MRQHTQDLSTPPTRAERRAEAAWDFMLALIVGFSLTMALIAWWTA